GRRGEMTSPDWAECRSVRSINVGSRPAEVSTIGNNEKPHLARRWFGGPGTWSVGAPSGRRRVGRAQRGPPFGAVVANSVGAPSGRRRVGRAQRGPPFFGSIPANGG